MLKIFVCCGSLPSGQLSRALYSKGKAVVIGVLPHLTQRARPDCEPSIFFCHLYLIAKVNSTEEIH